MVYINFLFFVHVWSALMSPCSSVGPLPVVINTWPFLQSNIIAANAVTSGRSYLDAIELGCITAEQNTSIESVGYGGSPNEDGETTLDAMIMDGQAHDVGSVGCLKEIKGAISVARSLMEHTEETLLVGEDGVLVQLQDLRCLWDSRENLSQLTTQSNKWNLFNSWKAMNCQPNYWKKGTVMPDSGTSCGPYGPLSVSNVDSNWHDVIRPPITEDNHDTIGMIVVDAEGNIGCGTSTNGANHKISGRVGDSPIIGSGCYVEATVGGAAATGDGDVMMRFVPAHEVVLMMGMGVSPKDAIEAALKKIKFYYPDFNGAMVAVTTSGEYGAGYSGFGGFQYTLFNPELGESTVLNA